MSVGEEIIYRPPLWSQESAYSAADDRRLIHAAMDNGVIEFNDLRVTPRQEGANMSVDVLPGEVVVAGTEQADQGTYLCSLAQRVNIPLAAAPSAGNTRSDGIIARVYEPHDEPAYWRVEAVSSPLGPAGTVPFPSFPPSSALLAHVVYIDAGLVQIEQNRIYDYRHLARPASTGSCLLRHARASNIVPSSELVWAAVEIRTPPLGQPIDIEVAFDGSLVPTETAMNVGLTMLRVRAGDPYGPWTHEIGWLTASCNTEVRPAFSRRTAIAPITLNFPDQLRVEGLIAPQPGYATPYFADGTLTVRVTPSGTALSW